jgi:hypothetical protein
LNRFYLHQLKALQASAQAMQSLRNFPFPLPLFSVEQVSRTSAHVIQASIQFEFFIFHDDIILCCN